MTIDLHTIAADMMLTAARDITTTDIYAYIGQAYDEAPTRADIGQITTLIRESAIDITWPDGSRDTEVDRLRAQLDLRDIELDRLCLLIDQLETQLAAQVLMLAELDRLRGGQASRAAAANLLAAIVRYGDLRETAPDEDEYGSPAARRLRALADELHGQIRHQLTGEKPPPGPLWCAASDIAGHKQLAAALVDNKPTCRACIRSMQHQGIDVDKQPLPAPAEDVAR